MVEDVRTDSRPAPPVAGTPAFPRAGETVPPLDLAALRRAADPAADFSDDPDEPVPFPDWLERLIAAFAIGLLAYLAAQIAIAWFDGRL